MNKTTIIYGPPGTGKTENLMNIIEKALANGTKSWSICYLSYTKAAVKIAIQRVMARFNLSQSAFPYFQTLHAFCKQQACINSNNIIQWKQKQEICEILGYLYRGISAESDNFGMDTGDKLFQLEELSRIKQITLKEVWEQSYEEDISLEELIRFATCYSKYKNSNLLLDFTDILGNFLDISIRHKLDYLIIDEAQDLSKLQWACVNKIAENSGKVYITGDDDQAIYGWNGADIDAFINLEGTKENLEQSYRIPKAVHNLSNNISGRINIRVKKTFKPRLETGYVNRIWHLSDLDMSIDNWLLLSRNSVFLTQYEEYCRDKGYDYLFKNNKSNAHSQQFTAIRLYETLRKRKMELSKKQLHILRKYLDNSFYVKNIEIPKISLFIQSEPWFKALTGLSDDDRQYFRKGLGNKEFNLQQSPRIRINTIHGAKGNEANNVVLLSDITNASYQNYLRNPDEEHRVWYVGVTRTKQNLFIVQPTTNKAYEI